MQTVAAIDKTAALAAKIASMSNAELNARVEQIYAMPDVEMTPDVVDELGEILLGKRPS